MSMEEWRPIDEAPSYDVSSLGRVRNGARLLTPREHSNGYLRVSLPIAGKTTDRYIHRLVAFAFCGRPPSTDAHADHINRVRHDNKATNIQWLTPTENRALRRFENGERHHCAKLSDETVRMIRADRSINNARLARMLGVRRETVRDIRLGRERVHV